MLDLLKGFPKNKNIYIYNYIYNIFTIDSPNGGFSIGKIKKKHLKQTHVLTKVLRTASLWIWPWSSQHGGAVVIPPVGMPVLRLPSPMCRGIAGASCPSLDHYGSFGYVSIPINTIFRGMNIHLPAILMFTRGTWFWHTAISIWGASKMELSHRDNSRWFKNQQNHALGYPSQLRKPPFLANQFIPKPTTLEKPT